MKRLLILLTALFVFSESYAQLDFTLNKKFTHCDSVRGKLTTQRTCYDVLMYDLDIKVDIDNKYISGSNTIKFLVVKDFRSMQIDLFANMKVEKIVWLDKELPFSRFCNAVYITFPDTVRKQTAHTIKIYYSGNPLVAKNPPWDAGFVWNKDSDGNPFVGVCCQGTGASLWYPCKDHQSDEPNEMLIRIAVPDGLDEVSNGRLKRKTKLGDGYTKFEWYVSSPINNYDVTLNISKYRHFSDFYVNAHYKDTLTLDYYVLPANYEKAVKQFPQAKPMMDAYYTYFGEYPFVKDGYKLVEAPYLGMEHQSCIAYGNKYKNGYLGFDRTNTGYKFDYIIIHESAHEWWGNSVTTNDVADMWIHEGFATYAEALYIEYLYGHSAYMEYINAERRDVNNEQPITGRYGVNNEGSTDMYPKGALLLHTIRSIINDDAKFFSILKGIQTDFRYQCVDSKDVENYISAKSGINFTKVFDLYLHKTSIPVLEVVLYKDFLDYKANYRFRFKDANLQYDSELENYDFTMPVKVTISERDKYELIYPKGKWQAINLGDFNPEFFKVASDLYYIDTNVKTDEGE